MAARCKIGDIAVIISAYHNENLGLIVRVIGTHDGEVPGIGRLEIAGPYWLVEGVRPMIYSNDKKCLETKLGPAPDCVLEPIRGRCSEKLAEQMAMQLLKKVQSLPDSVTVEIPSTQGYSHWADVPAEECFKKVALPSGKSYRRYCRHTWPCCPSRISLPHRTPLLRRNGRLASA